MPRPLVPRTGVVARVVARAAEGERRERRARAAVAVGDDLLRLADERANPLGRERRSVGAEELVDLQAPGAGNVALARVARAAAPSGVFLFAPDVEDRQRGIVEPRRELLTGRERARVRPEHG